MDRNRQRLIRVDRDKIHITARYYVDLKDTNLPYSTFRFKEKPFFWLAELKKYDKTERVILLDVIDYYPISTDLFSNQKLKNPISSIHFEPLTWAYLEPFLSVYQKSTLLPFIIDSDQVIVPDLTPKVYTYHTKTRLKDLTFKSGYIAFSMYLPPVGQEESIRIYNEHIRPEFELIKPVFGKMLKRKTFDVTVETQMAGDRLVHIRAHAPGLDKIDHKLIDTIRINQILGLRKEPIITAVDKSLFTSEDVFDQFESNIAANVLNVDVIDIIHTIADLRAVRNRQQLLYLAGHKHLEQHKVYITLQPTFGFVFTVKGAQMVHLCWELLNSHATYIWSFDPMNSDFQYMKNRVEKTIQSIRDQGRDRYKQAYRQGVLDEDLVFQTIVHQYAASKLQDPFPTWRMKLEERLL